jgi:hypothetical protein
MPDAGKKHPQPLQKFLFSGSGILTLLRVLIWRAICTYLSLLSGCKSCCSAASKKSLSMRCRAKSLIF